MAQNVYFNGELLTIPGAYSTTDVSAMSTKGDSDTAKVIALIGECTGGEPGVVQFFTEPTAARKVLKSGELLKACEKAWNPVSKSKTGVKLDGANLIACIRSNEATKSSTTINDGQLVISSKDWGANTAFQVKLQDGTVKGSKKLVTYDQVNGTYETIDNIGALFTLKYTGGQKYAEVNIQPSDDGYSYLTTKVGEDAGTATEDIKIKLDRIKIKSIKTLIGEIQAYENYQLVIPGNYNPRLKVTDLDEVSALDITSAQPITAVYADMKSKLENSSQLIELTSFDASKGKIENFDYITLEGGTEGVSPASWVKFFDALSNYDIFYIVPLTGDKAIHAELIAHINELSGSMGRERRCVLGGNIGETLLETIDRSKTAAFDRVQVVYGGFWDYDSNNELTLYPPYILAAQHAGRAAYLEDGEPATHDVYRMAAPEYKLERNEITQLLQNGVLAFEFVLGKTGTSQSYVRLVQDLTTDVLSTDTVHTERATGALADSINKQIREELDDLLTGRKTTSSDLTSAKNRIISILDDRKRKNQIIDYKDVYVTKSGTVTEVDFSVAPAEPNNFTLITAHYYSQDISAE
nr:MAG TPA: tail sheath protein [Herelleviridae sp.]